MSSTQRSINKLKVKAKPSPISPFPLPWLLLIICSLHWASAVRLDNLCRRVPNVSAVTEQPRLSTASASLGSALPASCPTCWPTTHMPSNPSFSSFIKPSMAATSTRNPLQPWMRCPRSRWVRWAAVGELERCFWFSVLLYSVSSVFALFPKPSFVFLVSDEQSDWAALPVFRLEFVSFWICWEKSAVDRKRREKMFSRSSRRNMAGTASR